MSFLEEDSILLSFDVNNLDQYLDVNNLRMFYYGVQGRWLAVATLRHLLVMEGVEGGPASECGERQQHIQIANFIPEYGYPMCLQWILGGVLIVGFDTGYAVCFDDSASVIAEHKFSENALVSIQVDNSSDRSVWLLYENGKCIAVSNIFYREYAILKISALGSDCCAYRRERGYRRNRDTCLDFQPVRRKRFPLSAVRFPLSFRRNFAGLVEEAYASSWY